MANPPEPTAEITVADNKMSKIRLNCFMLTS
jgi:hypothetical protein